MITEGELLQANVAIIAGILIFLSLAPIFREPLGQLMQKAYILWVLIFALCLLVGSTGLLLIPAIPWILSTFDIAKILFIGALGAVIGLVWGLYNVHRKLIERLNEEGKAKD